MKTRAKVSIDSRSWHQGYQNGLEGLRNPSMATDSYSYNAGQVEGRAERERQRKACHAPLSLNQFSVGYLND